LIEKMGILRIIYLIMVGKMLNNYKK
jgi:hypothetical protein